MLEKKLLSFFLKDDNKLQWNNEEKKQAIKEYTHMLKNEEGKNQLIKYINDILNNTCDPKIKKQGSNLINKIMEV